MFGEEVVGKHCDLQRVPKHCTGAVVRAMVLKQIESVGARTRLNPPDLPRHVVWWMCGSDQGQISFDGHRSLLKTLRVQSSNMLLPTPVEFNRQARRRAFGKVLVTGKDCKLYQELVTRRGGHVDNEIQTGERPACFQTVATTTLKGPVALDTFF